MLGCDLFAHTPWCFPVLSLSISINISHRGRVDSQEINVCKNFEIGKMSVTPLLHAVIDIFMKTHESSPYKRKNTSKKSPHTIGSLVCRIFP